MTDKIVLEAFADDIWLVNGECVDFYGFPYPTRMVIVRLGSGDLWIWSPIEYTTDIAAQVASLGEVAHLVSPNKIHHLFLTQWAGAFPHAKLWGPKSTIKKRTDLSFQSPLDNNPPEQWAGEIDQVWFNGSFYMDEVVFFHHKSKTAILADLSENFSEPFLVANWKSWQRTLARLWGIVEGRGYAPLEWRLSFFKKKSSKSAKARVLGWNPVRVVMAHGQWQMENGRVYLEKSFEWIR